MSDPDDLSQGALSDRVHFLKCEEEGIKLMCKVTEEIYEIGREEGLRLGKTEEARKAARNMAERGFGAEMIAEIIEESAEPCGSGLKRKQSKIHLPCSRSADKCVRQPSARGRQSSSIT